MKIFLSHSSQDKPFVEKLANDIKKLNIDVWLDKWEIKVGDSLISKISSGLSESDYFILVMSPHSVISEWVQKEFSYALIEEIESKSIKILPILLDNCEIPTLLRDKLFADFRENYDSGFEVLKNALLASNSEEKSKIFIEDIAILNDENRNKLCLDIILSNKRLNVVWLKKAIISSEIVVGGNGADIFLLKAQYRVILPYNIQNGNTFSAKVFENTENKFSQKCTGSFDFSNSSGTHTWNIQLSVPVYFKCYPKDKINLRIIFEKPKKKLLRQKKTGRNFSHMTYGLVKNDFVFQLIADDGEVIVFKKPEIAEDIITFIANN